MKKTGFILMLAVISGRKTARQAARDLDSKVRLYLSE